MNNWQQKLAKRKKPYQEHKYIPALFTILVISIMFD